MEELVLGMETNSRAIVPTVTPGTSVKHVRDIFVQHICSWRSGRVNSSKQLTVLGFFERGL